MQIKETTNYRTFKANEINREVNKNLLRDLTRSIGKIGLKMPIAIDKNNVIIDGQHRFLACKTLKKPVKYYRVETEDYRDLMVEVNNVSRKWSTLDYANFHMKNGNQTIGAALSTAYRFRAESKDRLSVGLGLEILKDGMAASTSGIKEGTYLSNHTTGNFIFELLKNMQKVVNYNVFDRKIVRPLKMLVYKEDRMNNEYTPEDFIHILSYSPDYNIFKGVDRDRYDYFWSCLYNAS